MTAIAAVFALSSTTLFAQSVDAPALTTPAPVIEVTSVPATADPLAAAPVADTAAASDPLAPEAAAKPAARKAATAKSTAARARPAPARVASAAPTVAAAPVVVSAPAAAAPIEPPLPIQAEAAPIQAPIAEPPAPANTSSINSVIPIAGFGALGILALTGVGLVVSRRRRRAEDAEADARRQFVEALPEADAEPVPEVTEPAFVRGIALEPTAEPDPSAELEGPVTELPEDFDLSGFTPHQQAAYKGPTEDNPSLSLKNRLSRANGMDQLEAHEAEAEEAEADSATTSPVRAPGAKPAVVGPANGDFMLRGPGTKLSQKPVVSPASSH